jgi:hypothetical protein
VVSPKGRHGTGEEKNTWHNDKPTPFLASVFFSFTPSPASARTTRISHTIPAPGHAGNERSASGIRPRRGHPPHSLCLAPRNFFSPSFPLPRLQIAIPNPNIFPSLSLPRLSHRCRRCSTLLPPPPPPRQVKARALWPSLDRELRPALSPTRRPCTRALVVGGGVGLSRWLGFECLGGRIFRPGSWVPIG